MISVLSCITFEHDPLNTILALLVCILGSVVTMRLFARVRRTEHLVKYVWLFLAGLIGGATIWSAHFIAMLGYETAVILGYEPRLTMLSLLIAVVTTTSGFFIASGTRNSVLIEGGGLIVGAGIALMHYTGIAAIQMDGTIAWNTNYVIASIVVACVFGIVATNRIARPVTRFCKHGGMTSFMTAIVALHFTGMAAMSIVPGARTANVGDAVSGGLLLVIVMFVTGLLIMTAVAAYVIDLQNARQAGERYRHLALHDPLTGVANRTGLEEHLGDVLDARRDDTARVAVVALDLDRFKEVNDVFGHAAGDELLRTFTGRVRRALGPGEFLARFGGDEFVAVKDPVYTPREAQAFCRRLIEIACEPVEWEGTSLVVSGSAGFSMFPDDARSTQSLIERADLAMYASKNAGRSNVSRYDASMEEATRERSVLAMDLERALAANQFIVHYQPQNDAVSRQIMGYEALIRWKHPERGMVPPDQFIPIAEENGLVVEIGNWVLREACRQAVGWRGGQKVAVNVAAAQLSRVDFPKLVHEVLLDTGLPAARLELEITESGIIADVPHALHVVRQLKNLGVSIAMDDFGTGYSSLATLQNFPFDKIKIDREFIKNVDENEQSAAIVRATVILAASLKKTVLAEGVETEAHMKFLESVGCNAVQGFLFGKPVSNEVILSGEAPERQEAIGTADPTAPDVEGKGPSRAVRRSAA